MIKKLLFLTMALIPSIPAIHTMYEKQEMEEDTLPAFEESSKKISFGRTLALTLKDQEVQQAGDRILSQPADNDEENEDIFLKIIMLSFNAYLGNKNEDALIKGGQKLGVLFPQTFDFSAAWDWCNDRIKKTEKLRSLIILWKKGESDPDACYFVPTRTEINQAQQRYKARQYKDKTLATLLGITYEPNDLPEIGSNFSD